MTQKETTAVGGVGVVADIAAAHVPDFGIEASGAWLVWYTRSLTRA